MAAFEQSLVNMTSRLRHLAETAEEKVRELGVLLPHRPGLTSPTLLSVTLNPPLREFPAFSIKSGRIPVPSPLPGTELVLPVPTNNTIVMSLLGH